MSQKLTREAIEGCGIEITSEVCHLCIEEVPGAQEALWAAQDERTRDIADFAHGLPANDPRWGDYHRVRAEVYAPYTHTCMVWVYDDSMIALCPRHLRALADVIDAGEAQDGK